ncbi:MAG: hypothetical protein QXX38_00410 [Candidatus Aenigmatarchaeota archaeon]
MFNNYKPKKICEISPNDIKVSLIGRIVEVSDNGFVLDDGTGRAEIFSELNLEENRFVRVFCSIIENKLNADIIQRLEGNLNLFKKVEELYKRWESNVQGNFV